jgi:hypothetical protein
MLIRKTSIATGITREMDLDITETQLRLWRSGVLIQHAMPELTPAQREFIQTGMTQEEWEEMWQEEE